MEEPQKLTIKALLNSQSDQDKKTLKEYFTTNIWNDELVRISSTGFFISLGVAAANEGIAGEGLSEDLRKAVLAEL